jgi:hypothetical protein
MKYLHPLLFGYHRHFLRKQPQNLFTWSQFIADLTNTSYYRYQRYTISRTCMYVNHHCLS